MAQLHRSFQTASVAPSQSRDPIPPGKYTVQIVASEWKPTKAGTGQYLSLELDILEGEHAGRKMWDLLNLDNPNPKAVEIAEETLRDICLAQGKVSCDDSEELHFIQMTATVKIKPGDANYGAKNEIGGYKALTGSAPAQRQAASIQRNAAPVAQQNARVGAHHAITGEIIPPAPSANAPAAAPWRRAAI